MNRSYYWRFALIFVVIVLALAFMLPLQDMVLERALETEVLADGKLESATRDVEHTSVWRNLLRRSQFERRTLVSEYEEDGKTIRKTRVEAVAAGKIKFGLDLRGGSELRYVMVGGGDRPHAQRDQDFENTVSTIRRRIDVYGLREPRVQREGTDRVLVQIPGMSRQEVERVKNIISTAGTLEFRLVSDNEPQLKEALAGSVPRGFHLYWVEGYNNKGEKIKVPKLVSDIAPLSGTFLKSASPGVGDAYQPIVHIEFDSEGSRIFERVTTERVGQELAIVLNTRRGEGGIITDPGVAYMAPVIDEPIAGGKASISGRFTRREVEDIATTLRSGSLPLDLDLTQESFIGPGLGEDSIRSGLMASIIALVAVPIFMVVYYMAGGLVANFALAMNVIIILGGLGALNASLTLPGIAGLVLTVGMAVDANILIFERIREEIKKSGGALEAAVKAGYDRAFITILDCNVTTIITGLILFYVGTEQVKGFGITLVIGLVANIFTAVFVTRTILETLVRTGVIKKLRMLRIMTTPNLRFIKYRRVAYFMSVILVAGGLITFYARGQKKLGIDFRGGLMAEIDLSQPLTAQEARERAATLGYKEVEIQSLSAGGAAEKPAAGKHSRFEIRAGGAVDEETFIDDLQKAFAAEILPPPFPVAERLPPAAAGTEDALAGGSRIEMNLARPLPVDEIREQLVKEGYPEASVRATGTDPGKDRASSVEVRVRSTRIEEVKTVLAGLFPVTDPIPRLENISAVVAAEMVTKAYVAILFSMVAMIVYIWFRFQFRFGVAAVIALVHDVAVVLGALAIFDALGLVNAKINLPIVAAVLTLIGYSVNDTLVIFDRVRENLGTMRRISFSDLMDASINQTLARTILTSLTVFMVVCILFVVQGPQGVLSGFAFALMVGVITGTYSTVYVAGAVVSDWYLRRPRGSQRK